jgi:Uncharacterised protein family (UPF0236)
MSGHRFVGATARSKKLCWQTTYGTVTVTEHRLRHGRRGAVQRPFCEQAQIQPRGYSRPLQAAMTDFGAEVSFAQASARLHQHYGIDVPPTAVRRVSLHHGRQLQDWTPPRRTTPDAARMVGECDGSLIPLREPLVTNAAGKRTMPRAWKEVRLCAARADGVSQARYGATMGSVLEVGELWEQTARAAGLGEPTRVHGVGDGAPWIAEQFDRHFGGQGRYLVDFYHVTEYLAAAAPTCAPRAAIAWVGRQQERLKANQLDRVLRDLIAHLEPEPAGRRRPRRETEELVTPVRDCERYLRARREQLDYAGALAAGLPIGSGLIESGHRHVVQARLKKAGAWWYRQHAHSMLALRVVRANGDWKQYWNSLN